MSENTLLQPVILSGGSGTRLWPLSRKNFPKQYIQFNLTSKYSSLQKTQNRLFGIKNIQNPIIICNEEQRFTLAEQMREIMVKPKSIILEPEGRNTAPAIAIAALKAIEESKDPILLILSSDHEIEDQEKFIEIIKAGIKTANRDKLVNFGVKPTSPETGYGYIEAIKNIKNNSLESVQINRFIEKPNQEKATNYIKDERYFWNSGIFLFKASTILKELEKFQPRLLEYCKLSIRNSSKDFDFQRLEKQSFKKCPNLSIDYAVMENTNNAYVIPFNAGWSDVGSWKSIWDLEKKDKNGNSIIGDIKVRSVKNCYLNSKNKLLVAIGTENLIIVQTKDATLVANHNNSQEIKDIVSQLNLENRVEGREHQKVFRPWGYYNSIEKGSNWQVKEILVKPYSSLSLQKHKFRSEHWIILNGEANIEINDEKITLKENQSTFIPAGAKHRLSNNQETSLRLIEVQSGSYLGEDDIYRYDDNYGRKS